LKIQKQKKWVLETNRSRSNRGESPRGRREKKKPGPSGGTLSQGRVKMIQSSPHTGRGEERRKYHRNLLQEEEKKNWGGGKVRTKTKKKLAPKIKQTKPLGVVKGAWEKLGGEKHCKKIRNLENWKGKKPGVVDWGLWNQKASEKKREKKTVGNKNQKNEAALG